MKLADLSTNPRNPRKMSDDRLVMLRKSLDEFGDLGGTVFNRRSKQLVGGHQRGKVLPQDADIVITQHYDPPSRTGTVAEGYILVAGEKFKYREVDWDEKKELAANLAANKHSGEWDYPVYADLVLELEHANYDLDLTGHTSDDLEKLLAYVPKTPGTTNVEFQAKEKELDENIETESECPSCGYKW